LKISQNLSKIKVAKAIVFCFDSPSVKNWGLFLFLCYNLDMEKITTEEKEMTVTGADGVPVTVMAKVITTDHGVTDEEGNPKISVEIKVPAITVGVTPGEVE